MKNSSLLKIIIILLVWIKATIALATMPVVDYTEIADTLQVLDTLQKQYTELQDQLKTMKNQYDQMVEEYQTMTGHYGWGMFKNDMNYFVENRQWTNENWNDSLNSLAGNNSERYQELIDQYKESNKLSMVDSDKYQKGSDPLFVESYANQIKTNQLSAGLGTYEINTISQHLLDLQNLGEKIEDIDKNNDLKAAIDLQARITIETGFIQTEMLRMVSLINQQLAQLQATYITQQTQVSQFTIAGEIS